jgi:hypothetical protein
MPLNSFPHTSSDSHRYFIAYDRIDADDKIYGILRLDTLSSSSDGIEIQFSNEIGNISLTAREISQSEWETMKEFDLFPVLHSFNKQRILREIIQGNVNNPGKQVKSHRVVTQFMVHFRDY